MLTLLEDSFRIDIKAMKKNVFTTVTMLSLSLWTTFAVAQTADTESAQTQNNEQITNDEAKANVLATVCNNLQSEIQDDWVEKCMCKIADYDEDTEDEKLTKEIKYFLDNN